MGVGCGVDDPVALLDTEILKHRRPAVRAVEERPVGQAELTVDHRLPLWVQTASPAREL